MKRERLPRSKPRARAGHTIGIFIPLAKTHFRGKMKIPLTPAEGSEDRRELKVIESGKREGVSLLGLCRFQKNLNSDSLAVLGIFLESIPESLAKRIVK